jgi:hypothetical protein
MAHLKLYSRGGVGNQMFQYAFAHHLRALTDMDIELAFRDKIRGNHVRERRRPELLNFRLDESTQFSSSSRDLLWWGLIPSLLQMQRGPFSEFAKFVGDRLGIVSDNRVGELMSRSGWKDVRLFGYWIIRDYFLRHQITLRQCFELKEELPARLRDIQSAAMSAEGNMAIHVRRGDYFSPGLLGSYGVLTGDYYSAALDLAIQKTGNISRVFIFTDDEHWVASNLLPNLPSSALYSVVNQGPSETAAQHLVLMSSFSTLVLSNSTFSWWGATLGPEKKVVISPADWGPSFGNANLSSQDWLSVER